MKTDTSDDKYYPPGLWDLSCENQRLESMIIVYEEHIETLEAENEGLKAEILFLKEQLEYKTMGMPNGDTEDNYSERSGS